MFKKIVSIISLSAVFSSLISLPAFAEPVQENSIIQSVVLTVPGSTPQTFEPTAATPQTLKTAVTFKTSVFGQALKASTGYAKVLKGNIVIKTLNEWTNADAAAQAFADWDGKAINDTAEAKGICGSTGAACPEGDYKIEVRVEYPDQGNSIFDLEPVNFKIFKTPEVAISGLLVSPSTFNPTSQTADISFTTSANGFITVEVFDGTTLKKTILSNKSLPAGSYNKNNESLLAWNGKDDSGNLLSNKSYTVKVSSRKEASGAVLDTKPFDVTVNAASLIEFTSMVLKFSPTIAGGTFDPALSAGNQDLLVEYVTNQTPDSVALEISDSKNTVLKTGSSSLTASNFTWDGHYNSKLVPAGIYNVKLTATKTGSVAAIKTLPLTVSYPNANKGELINFNVAPDTFDPDFAEGIIAFKNTKDANLTVEIQNISNNGTVRSFSTYKDQNYSANSSHSIPWNGKDDNGSDVSLSTYKVSVISRNDFGVVVMEKNITVNNDGGSVTSSNAHIDGISFSPSSKFEPAKNDELKIEYDVKKEIDELKIFAIRGAEKIEILSESDLEQENNLEVTWDGRDKDDEYVDQGSWKFQFQSKLGSTTLFAQRSINVEYEKPEIDDLYISKSKFDPDLGEFTYIIFRLDSESDVTIKLLEDNDEQEDIVEDLEVDANKWYAVAWDGDNYNHDDDIDFKILAQNLANHDIFDSEKISVDLAEDEVSSSKSNVTMDYISPILTNGNDDMTIYYDLEEDADVEISIHKGTSSSGTKVIQLLDVEDQASGEHNVSWNGRDKDGKKLSSGLYTYKIVSSTGGTDTETGLFVVGAVGDVEGGEAGSGDSSDNDVKKSSGKVSSNVVIDGGDEKVSKEEKEEVKVEKSSLEYCAGFSDVSEKSEKCAAIKWVKEAGIFSGYSDGTFGEFRAINRVELLKVILEAFDIAVPASVSGNLGFKDVVPGAWYMPYVKAAKDKGIFSGDGKTGTARPADLINRVESLKLVFESMKNAGLISLVGSGCSTDYSDVASGSWYANYVCEAANFGFFPTKGSNFNPSNFASRGEVAEIFYKLHQVNLL